MGGGRGGFATVPLALLMVTLAGVIVLARLAPGSPDDLRQAKLTHAKMAALERALVTFAALQGRLPCPAALAQGDEAPCADAVVSLGGVPTASLGLDPTAGRDAWGRLFTYGVTTALARPGGWTGGAAGAVIVRPRPGITKPKAWVLVSHGENGRGARRANATLVDDPAGPRERDNLGRPPDGDMPGFAAGPHDGAEPGGEGYDDLLRAGDPP
ncbi:hypothetical protein [Rhodospirillum rubrum]|uniref:General secretion pathway protein H n=1 Tax=Rhodospirillum rubrum (strain ATCC 11170 / ATH 1.1.1 / DSM 467 / LMG 4362 / NCIMB 8255 / S1) TaxID=269796 RepID=Q2RNH6_RHORT|nr:hypothetical protein [Rhodospirillum rubrum]ABC24319.1 hypothetical protein Rru_A3525 [Rhodospirillum rubrum ATCC 11170]AEO50070.1 hypothetical protein F11_18050 [Rhodospirillum rubrum F11]MBK5956038.1 hypothetical protein [Rhodospirillum rubrum]QXG80246.1 hypothetical protein KUL73_18195 [Rhodospirillum rubrum]HCF17177.1 hypothetical protein [Rhodospirillum rubrum]